LCNLITYFKMAKKRNNTSKQKPKEVSEKTQTSVTLS